MICHNANCSDRASSLDDDTLDALDASLEAAPGIIDGIEIDLLWFEDRCVLAHGLDARDPVPAELVGSRIADFLSVSAPTPSGEPFMLFVELKGAGDPPAVALAECMFDVVDQVSAIAPIQVVVSSFSNTLLSTVAADDRWRAIGGSLVAELLPPTRDRLADFDVQLDAISIDPFQLDRQTLIRIDDLELDVALWSDAVTPKLFDWIEAATPRSVSVGDVALVRAWIDG